MDGDTDASDRLAIESRDTFSVGVIWIGICESICSDSGSPQFFSPEKSSLISVSMVFSPSEISRIFRPVRLLLMIDWMEDGVRFISLRYSLSNV